MHGRIDPRIKLALIYGSTRESRLCDKVAGWAAAQIEGDGPFDLHIVDPATLDLPERHSRSPHEGLRSLRETHRTGPTASSSSRRSIIAAITAALKFLIDLVHDEWRGKPVGFVSYGGISGGLRAVEQLRLVFAQLHATTIRDGVIFTHAWNQFDSAGRLLDAERPEQAMATMLAQLHWWASALKPARASVPYGQFAL